MTQSNYRPTLAIKLASMQPPEAADSSALAGFAANNTEVAIANNLLLQPGEPGEMLVQLENLGGRSLRWRLEIEGDFPLNWCSWQQEEAEEIAPNQKVDRALYFQIPEDYFENQYALNRGCDRLKINYETQVYVYAEGQTERQLIAYRVFNLYVRPSNSYLNFLPGIYPTRYWDLAEFVQDDYRRRILGEKAAGLDNALRWARDGDPEIRDFATGVLEKIDTCRTAIFDKTGVISATEAIGQALSRSSRSRACR